MIETGFPTGGPTLGELGERDVISLIRAQAPSALNGDDAAVLAQSAPNSRVVASTDMLVQGRHFTEQTTTPYFLGRKAAVQNFADIEAMGARPIAALMAVSAPADMPARVLEELARGVGEMAADYACELVGGDVTAGEYLVVTVTAIGALGGNRPPLTLDGARPGQRVVAHGRIGYSAAGLALLQAGVEIPGELEPLVHAHQVPELTPGRGVVARAAKACSMTDNSDGLIRDLSQLAEASGVGIELASTALSPDALLVAAGELLGVDPWDWVLRGGEDHTLVGTTEGSAPVGFRSIGKVSRKPGVRIDGAAPATTHGWESF